MKILGISCGRRMSNTEILVKEALMGAEAAGAEVEFVRLHDYKLKPCTGCNACVVDLLEKSGSGKCTIKDDDFALIDEKILDCDGMIVGSPIYEKSPSGLLKTLNDRMGPSHDLAFRTIAKQIRTAKNITTGTGPDERSFKQRAASLIAVGGSEWDTLALPMLHLFALPMQFEVVDKILANWVALPGSVTLREDLLERARISGEHIVKSLSKDISEAEFIGKKGACPLCHSDVVEIRNGNEAKCGICGVIGTLNMVDGTMKLDVTDEAKAHSHVLLSGKFEHAKELNEVSLKKADNAHEIPERLKKYRGYLASTK
ncbi:putative NAD(P)H-dependent FMN-containing oxidoreductase YwqN [compost metagenome]